MLTYYLPIACNNMWATSGKASDKVSDLALQLLPNYRVTFSQLISIVFTKPDFWSTKVPYASFRLQ